MMKRFLIPLLFLLLTGCAAHNPVVEESTPAPALADTAVQSQSASDPALESQASSPLFTYHLATAPNGILPLGEDLLLFFAGEDPGVSLLDTRAMTMAASHAPGLPLLPENATVQRLQEGFSYFSSASMETLVLDQALQIIRRIPAPADLIGFPLLSRDSKTLFYCTAHSIRALDLSSGISRILKEAAYPVQGLSGLLLEDSVVQVSITDSTGQWSTLFLSAQTGQLLQQQEGNILPETAGQSYFLKKQEEAIQNLFFGSLDGMVQTLHPQHPDSDFFFLEESNTLLSSAVFPDRTLLELYDLSASGQRTAALELPGSHVLVNAVQTRSGDIWFHCREDDALYRWDSSASSVSDPACYADAHYTRSEPDYEGLAAAALYAQTLSQKYGIDIQIYKDAAAVQPWDYQLEYEHQASLLHRELEKLDQRLGQFPAGFLQTLAGRFTGLHLCLVRSITGTPESGSLDMVNGLQFFVDFDAYLVLATQQDTEHALYHELSHLMETLILTESTAFDRWDNLNPSEFQYDYDVTANLTRDGRPWLQPGREYFIDTYSMSYPKEDRARILEYAMTDGHEALFASPNLQRKLRQLSLGIREAFRLEHTAEPLPWEQYLLDPIA